MIVEASKLTLKRGRNIVKNDQICFQPIISLEEIDFPQYEELEYNKHIYGHNRPPESGENLKKVWTLWGKDIDI